MDDQPWTVKLGTVCSQTTGTPSNPISTAQRPSLERQLAKPTWPIWLRESIAAAAAIIGVGLAFAKPGGTVSSQLLIAQRIVLAIMALFAVITRADQGVAAIATVLTIVSIGNSIVYAINGGHTLTALQVLPARERIQIPRPHGFARFRRSRTIATHTMSIHAQTRQIRQNGIAPDNDILRVINSR